MLATGVDFEFGQHLPTDFVFWKHATNRVTHDLFGFSIQTGLSRFRSKSGVPGVPSVSFLVELVAREFYLVTVNQDDEFASINVRCVGRSMLSHQNHGDVRSDAADNLIFTVDDIPGSFDRVRLSVV